MPFPPPWRQWEACCYPTVIFLHYFEQTLEFLLWLGSFDLFLSRRPRWKQRMRKQSSAAMPWDTPHMLGMGHRAPHPSWKNMRKFQRVAHACTSAGVCIEGCNPWRSLGDTQPQVKSEGKPPWGFSAPLKKFKRNNVLAHETRVRSACAEVPKGLPTPATAATNTPAPVHAFLRPARLARINSEWQATPGGREEEQIIEMKCQVNKPNATKMGWKK